MEQIRVLHITETLSAAGIESFIMNLYRNIDRERVQFDFLTLRDKKEFYEDEIGKLGGKKYWIHSPIKNTLLRIIHESKLLEKFLSEHKYNIVHIHYTTPLRAPFLIACHRAGVKIRIYHSHSAFVLGKSRVKMMTYEYMRGLISKHATHFFACSNAAAEWMYKKELITAGKARIIYNGIDIQKFSYNSESRNRIRKELGITDDEFVLIHTGRFTEQKNQSFVVKIFNEVKKKHAGAKLLLLGHGDMMEQVKNMVEGYSLQNDVFFLGLRSNVYDFLSAADVYLMPSLYEGLPVAAVEAQCSGLPCVISSNITKEIVLIDKVSVLDLDVDAEKWAEEVLKYLKCTRASEPQIISDAGYDMGVIAREMQNFYLKGAFDD